MGTFAIPQDFGIIKTGELLAFPGSVSESATRQISGSAAELIRSITTVLEDLALLAIEKRSAAEFESARNEVFPKYFSAVLAVSSLIQILVPQQAIERLNREFFCELEADLRESGLQSFGSAVTEQLIFTVWTLRKISSYMSQIAGGQSDSVSVDKQAAIKDLGTECIYHAIRTRFHIHCLTVSISENRPLHPELMNPIMDGLRSVVNAYGLARRLLDIFVPVSEPVIDAPQWDDEDSNLLAESAYDTEGDFA